MIQRPPLRSLKQQEIKILMELQENPFITFEDLAQKTEISKTVVFRTLKKLEDPVLQPPYLKIVAIPNLPALNLENIDVFIEAERPDEIKTVLSLCQEHPYIWYYARCYGKINGFLIQYRIPLGTRPQIKELLDILKIKHLIRNFYTLDFAGNALHTHPQVKNWDFETLSWNFNWKDWFHKTKKKNQIPLKNNIEDQNTLNLQKMDLMILRELLRNSRRKNIDIIQKLKTYNYEISPQQFSKKANRLKKEFIAAYRAEIHPETIDILNSVLLWGRGEPDQIQNIADKLNINAIPFHSTLKHYKTFIYWYIHISTVQLSELLLSLRPLLSELHFFFIDFPHSKTYLLETDNFDEKTKKWIQTDQFQIYNVLDKILKAS